MKTRRKKLILIGIATFTIFTIGQNGHANDSYEKCKVSSDFARAVMSGRQTGVKMSDMLEVIKSANPEIKEILEYIIIEAYQESRYSTESIKEKTITDFENSIYLECVKANK